MQKKKGISLIVLVITIIVMIILAAAIILSLNNAGIIGNANKAVDESNIDTIKSEADLKYAEYLITNNSKIEEDKLEEWLNQQVKHDGYYIMIYEGQTYVLKEGSLAYSIHKGDANIGDYVSYDAGTETVTVKSYSGTKDENNMIEKDVDITPTVGMKWRILGLEGDKVKLISEEVFKPGGNNFSLYGAYSYLKAEEILDNACKPFGNGVYAEYARSIKAEDIDLIMGYEKEEYIGYMGFTAGSFNKPVKYGTLLSYDDKSVLPGTNMTLHTITYPDINGVSYLTTGKYSFEYTAYEYKATDYKDNTKEEYKLFFRDKSNTMDVLYFVATTAVAGITDTGVYFKINYVGDGDRGTAILYVGGDDNRYSDSEWLQTLPLRPVVILESNVMTDKVVTEDSTVIWNLK